MENIIDSIDNAYQEFVDEISSFLEAKQSCEGQPKSVSSLGSNFGMESLAHKWEAFKHACDQGEEFVNYEKQRIACKSTVDNAIAESINGCEFVEDDSTTTFEDAKVVEYDDDNDKSAEGPDE